MKANQLAASSILILSCTGCVSIPPDAAAFRRDSTTQTRFVADASLRSAYELIAANTVRCHQGDASQMSTVSGMHFEFPVGSKRVEGTIDDVSGRAEIAVRFDNLTHHGMLQVIDLVREGDAQTRIEVHQLNDTNKWKTASASVEGWFAGKDDCYQL